MIDSIAKAMVEEGSRTTGLSRYSNDDFAILDARISNSFEFYPLLNTDKSELTAKPILRYL